MSPRTMRTYEPSADLQPPLPLVSSATGRPAPWRAGRPPAAAGWHGVKPYALERARRLVQEAPSPGDCLPPRAAAEERRRARHQKRLGVAEVTGPPGAVPHAGAAEGGAEACCQRRNATGERAARRRARGLRVPWQGNRRGLGVSFGLNLRRPRQCRQAPRAARPRRLARRFRRRRGSGPPVGPRRGNWRGGGIVKSGSGGLANFFPAWRVAISWSVKLDGGGLPGLERPAGTAAAAASPV